MPTTAKETSTPVPETRTLDELLKDYSHTQSFSGWTDAEIDVYIDYMAGLKHTAKAYQEACEQNKRLIDAQVQAWQEQSAAATKALNELAAAAANPQFITIDGAVNNG